ncbi:MAG: transposase [Deltaproteobacteria bacterium]|nr:transposase [Deltaproteobacteria bacterium]
MSRPKQLEMFRRPVLEHGGGLRAGRRKTYRPFDPRKPIHIVLRSSRARGDWSLLAPANARRVSTIVSKFAKKFRVRVMQFENVGNHVHLLVQAGRREDFRSFMRTIPAQIATAVTGARKGRALKPLRGHDAPKMHSDRSSYREQEVSRQTESRETTDAKEPRRKFWDSLAYSRVVHWGRDLLGLRHYLTKNAFEGTGIELLTTAGVVKRFFIRSGRLIV